MNKQTLVELAELAHRINANNGFWNAPRSEARTAALTSSEASECLEADRKKRVCANDVPAFFLELIVKKEATVEAFKESFAKTIKDTVPCEIADYFIRSVDAWQGIEAGKITDEEGRVTTTVGGGWASDAVAQVVLDLKRDLARHLPAFVLGHYGNDADLLIHRINYAQLLTLGVFKRQYYSQDGKPVAIELFELNYIDSVIYSIAFALWWAECMNIDLEAFVRVTLHNNSLRGEKHGKAY